MSDKSTSGSLGKISAERKSGKERFYKVTGEFEFDLQDFWRWSCSDLVDNTQRGILAEYIVARAIGAPLDSVRDNWAPYDLVSATGVKVEVKSSAYLQSWRQKDYSKISFNISQSREWGDQVGDWVGEDLVRQADVYVFALLAHKEQVTLNPLNLDQWQFYVLDSSFLNEKVGNQKSISLSFLQNLFETPLSFEQLGSAVNN